MPTPASGTISMNDMRTHINRATGSAISMSEMRDRYGGSGAISFSNLYNSEGFTINPARRTVTGKFAADYDGWSSISGLTNGSISPDEGSGRLQFATNSWLTEVQESSFVAGSTQISIDPNSTGYTANGDAVTAGFKTTSVSRVVLANTSRSITSNASGASTSYVLVSYDMPTSGTIHCLMKF
jgi:hypothetical protein